MKIRPRLEYLNSITNLLKFKKANLFWSEYLSLLKQINYSTLYISSLVMSNYII